jgi:4-amino-4-deoxy-L-arabinose transferase-like glycosyltransferase
MYLSFSDSAKFADVARNLVNGLGYGNIFSFWSSSIFELIKVKIFPSAWTPPLMPFSMAFLFKIFGVTDFAVLATSFFYFILTLIFVFLLAKKNTSK